MNDDNTKENSVQPPDESIQLVTDNLSIHSNLQTERRTNDMLTRKILTEHRLMRWCALILTLSTLIIVWRYVTILILSVWLSSICRPILEWLVNHL